MRVSLLPLILLLPITPLAANETEPEDPVEARVQVLSDEIEATRDPNVRTELAAVIVALGDSLEAAGRVGVAADCYRHAGWAAFRTGRTPVAAERWQHALELARQDDDPTRLGLALDATAVGHAVMGDYDPALDLWAEALRTYQSYGDEARESATLGNLANAYNITGRIPEAKTTTVRAIELARRSGNENGIFSAHHRLAGILHQMGDLEGALAQTDSALAMSEGQPQRLSRMLVRRSTILWDLDRREEAFAAIEQCMQLARELGDERAVRFAQANRAVMLLSAQRPEEALEAIESLGPEWRNETEIAGIQVDTVRGQALLQMGREEEARTTLVAARDELERLRSLQEDRATAESLHDTAGEVYSVLTRIDLAQGRISDAWAETERGRSAVLRSLLAGDEGNPATLDQVQAQLRNANAALLQFSESGSQTTEVFVVTADSLLNVSAQHPYSTREIVRAGLARMATGLPDEECRPALRRVGEAVLDNAVAVIPDSITRLYIVAPSLLDNFPYGAIPYPDVDSPPLSQRFAIAYLPGASSLPILSGRSATARGMTIFADPALPPSIARAGDGNAQARGFHLAALPHARDEARSIAIRGARILLGEDATARALRESPLGAVLHFATHALVDVFRSDRSGLVLAGDDGLISAPDVEALTMSPDLVTLSGCRTNGGYQLTGEGTVGLTRAFLVAGSRSVVTSLWEVRDDAARRFMDVFYRELRSGAPRDVALQRTREVLRQEGYPLRDRAAFVITGVGHEAVPALAGAPGSGGVNGRSRRLLLVLGGAIAVAAFLLLRRRASSRTV